MELTTGELVSWTIVSIASISFFVAATNAFINKTKNKRLPNSESAK